MSQYNAAMRRAAVICAVILVMAGCVRRTITVTSDPAGALLWLNGVEVGRTPVEVDFLHYGDYDVQLVLDGHEPLVTSARAKPPWWDNVPLDLIAEMTPGETRATVAWHFELQRRNDDPAALLDRARELRSRVEPVVADERTP